MILTRFEHRDNCTIGTLQVGDKIFYTMERPWQKNQRSVSCIPEGVYSFIPHGWEENTQVKFKKVWKLRNVPNRSDILIHVGNFPEDTYGCILVGTGVKLTEDSAMITNSKDAIEYLRKTIKNGLIEIKG